MRISDWSSDVCSSDLLLDHAFVNVAQATVQPLDLILVVCRAGGIAFGHWSKTVRDVADALGDVQAYPKHAGWVDFACRVSVAKKGHGNRPHATFVACPHTVIEHGRVSWRDRVRQNL